MGRLGEDTEEETRRERSLLTREPRTAKGVDKGVGVPREG